ncbi:hypothetical protein DY000_02013864 [Brassica cretica]|uniref:Uncharacterized protein n=1 Tax=Brassica cretica TaxID=69181 RepID=A0ABQ7CQT3_BRACR|nr:hypothetical protein DY000_02013864 [Brassica cretica]
MQTANQASLQQLGDTVSTLAARIEALTTALTARVDPQGQPEMFFAVVVGTKRYSLRKVGLLVIFLQALLGLQAIDFSPFIVRI